jgi:hypothetical protein
MAPRPVCSPNRQVGTVGGRDPVGKSSLYENEILIYYYYLFIYEAKDLGLGVH